MSELHFAYAKFCFLTARFQAAALLLAAVVVATTAAVLAAAS